MAAPSRAAERFNPGFRMDCGRRPPSASLAILPPIARSANTPFVGWRRCPAVARHGQPLSIAIALGRGCFGGLFGRGGWYTVGRVMDQRTAKEIMSCRRVGVGASCVRADISTIRGSTAPIGQGGAILLCVSAKEGKKLGELKLDACPVFDGLAAAEGKLFIAMMDGSVVCCK